MKWIVKRVEENPAMFAEVLKAGILLAMGFGLTISIEQLALITSFIGLLIQFFLVRAYVWPNVTVEKMMRDEA